MSMFAQRVAKEPLRGSSNGLFFLPGKYLVEIDEVKLIESADPLKNKAEMFIIISNILESSNPERPAGMKGVSQILNGNHPGAMSDCKRFLLTLEPSLTDEKIPDFMEKITGAEQEAHGAVLELDTYFKVSKKTGNKFTVHRWSRPGESAGEAETEAKD